MNRKNSFPTPYRDINAILNRLLAATRLVLGNSFLGFYIHGSLAYGDFNPQTSDIDFLVVTEDMLPSVNFFALKEMHARLFSSGLPWSQKLEGAYIPRKALRRHDPAHVPVPWLGEDGHFALEALGSDWIIQRWILREKGIVVAGPPPAGLIDPVSAQDLRQAVAGSLRGWWSPPFPSPDRFQSGEYQVYAILTMCRSLYMLQHGAVASKPEAARWAMSILPGPQRELIASTAAWKPGMEFNRLEDVFGFIRFTLKEWGLS
jgi:hypothetical protein